MSSLPNPNAPASWIVQHSEGAKSPYRTRTVVQSRTHFRQEQLFRKGLLKHPDMADRSRCCADTHQQNEAAMLRAYEEGLYTMQGRFTVALWLMK